MKTADDIAAEYRAMIALKSRAREGTLLEYWANGAIFALGWLAEDKGPHGDLAIPPSVGFVDYCIPALKSDLRPELSSRKDPALP